MRHIDPTTYVTGQVMTWERAWFGGHRDVAQPGLVDAAVVFAPVSSDEVAEPRLSPPAGAGGD